MPSTATTFPWTKTWDVYSEGDRLDTMVSGIKDSFRERYVQEPGVF